MDADRQLAVKVCQVDLDDPSNNLNDAVFSAMAHERDMARHDIIAFRTVDVVRTAKGKCALHITSVLGERTLQEYVNSTRYVERRGDISWIIKGVVKALHHMHSFGFAHCDVKPCNILISTARKTVTLIDFGSVRHVSRNVRGQQIAYTTFQYAAPEMLATGRSPSFAGDAFSVGVMIYMLVFTKYPVDLCDVQTDRIKAHERLRAALDRQGGLLFGVTHTHNIDPSVLEAMQGLLMADPARRLTINALHARLSGDDVPMTSFRDRDGDDDDDLDPMQMISSQARDDAIDRMFETCSDGDSLPSFGLAVNLMCRYGFGSVAVQWTEHASAACLALAEAVLDPDRHRRRVAPEVKSQMMRIMKALHMRLDVFAADHVLLTERSHHTIRYPLLRDVLKLACGCTQRAVQLYYDLSC